MQHPASSSNNHLMIRTTTSANFEDSKYAVADILSTFATGDDSLTPLNLSTPMPVSSTTDLLTPTTLANLERTFQELQSSIAPTAHTISLPRESGFVPPIVDPLPATAGLPHQSQMVKQELDYADYYQDDSSQDVDSEWLPPSNKRGRYNDQDMMLEAYQGTGAGDMHSSVPGRRRKHNEHATPQEEARRHVRRERNKVAAAKCRQRRVDLTNTLIHESEGLEEEQSGLENEIQMLQQQKEQLEFLLEAHKPVCSAHVSDNTACSSVKAGRVNISYPSILMTTVGTSTSATTTSSRPNTLSIPAIKQTPSTCAVTMATGVPITTPSAVFNFGLDSMLDGHTGLTPITGAPSCASQMHRQSTDGSTSSENLSSPTTLLAL